MSGVFGVIFGAVCVIAAIVLLIKRYETKTVLFGTGLVMTIAAFEPLLAFDAFQKSMVSEGLIWSICSVMGFSYVMKITEVDKHLVNGLAKILMKARPVLIPGVVICTFLVNISLNSAAGVTAAVGTIFIPLLISVGVKPAMAAAAVIFGTWGSMLSPGLSHQPIIAKIAGMDVIEVIKVHALTDITAMLTAAAALTIMAKILKEDKGYIDETNSFNVDTNFKVNPFYAVMPLVPVIMLLVLSIQDVRAAVPWAERIAIPHAMLIGAILCIAATRTNPAKATNEFFSGMGKGYGDIFGIIMCAAVFVAGMKSLGLVDAFITGLKNSEHLVSIAATYGPFLLGVVSGSGDAATIAFNESVTIHAQVFGLEPVNMGSIAALAGAIGRAASPIAGATIVAAGIAKVSPFEIAKRTAPGAVLASIVSMVMLLYM